MHLHPTKLVFCLAEVEVFNALTILGSSCVRSHFYV